MDTGSVAPGTKVNGLFINTPGIMKTSANRCILSHPPSHDTGMSRYHVTPKFNEVGATTPTLPHSHTPKPPYHATPTCHAEVQRRRKQAKREGGSHTSHGQSLIETCIAMGLICLMFMAALQVSQVLAAREILYHSAARGARARTVGFNRFMVRKCMRVAAIPNAGKMLTPEPASSISPMSTALQKVLADREDHSGHIKYTYGWLWESVLEEKNGLAPRTAQYEMEEASIPYYLGSENESRARHILDYEDWDTVQTPSPSANDIIVQSAVEQDFPLKMPMHRTFYGADSVELKGESKMESHFKVYLDDQYR